MIKTKHPITDELLDQLLTNYQKLEDLIGCALPVYAGREAAVGAEADSQMCLSNDHSYRAASASQSLFRISLSAYLTELLLLPETKSISEERDSSN